jgi:hypothetical protein
MKKTSRGVKVASVIEKSSDINPKKTIKKMDGGILQMIGTGSQSWNDVQKGRGY